MKPFHLRRTKIVATIGPACANPETLLDMINAGMDVARLNFSHADHPTHEKSLNMVRSINEQHNTNIVILQDLQGPKIRIGDLKEPLEIKPGQTFTMRTDTKEHKGNVLPIVYDTFAQDVKVGDPILIDDGQVECKVVETNGKNRVKLEVLYGDLIKSRKGVNLHKRILLLQRLPKKTSKTWISPSSTMWNG